MSLNLDTSSEFGALVAARLRDEQLIWLTTVGSDGTPQPNPVWFHWDGDTFLIFSQPTSAKVRHLAENPRVALNFHTNQSGGDVVVFTGQARVADAPPPDARLSEYLTKYAEGIRHLEMTPEKLLATYSTVLNVTPDKVRGF